MATQQSEGLALCVYEFHKKFNVTFKPLLTPLHNFSSGQTGDQRKAICSAYHGKSLLLPSNTYNSSSRERCLNAASGKELIVFDCNSLKNNQIAIINQSILNDLVFLNFFKDDTHVST